MLPDLSKYVLNGRVFGRDQSALVDGASYTITNESLHPLVECKARKLGSLWMLEVNDKRSIPDLYTLCGWIHPTNWVGAYGFVYLGSPEGRLIWSPSNDKNAERGCVCARCNSRNEWAEPNRKDGTYVCFECR